MRCQILPKGQPLHFHETALPKLWTCFDPQKEPKEFRIPQIREPQIPVPTTALLPTKVVFGRSFREPSGRPGHFHTNNNPTGGHTLFFPGCYFCQQTLKYIENPQYYIFILHHQSLFFHANQSTKFDNLFTKRRLLWQQTTTLNTMKVLKNPSSHSTRMTRHNPSSVKNMAFPHLMLYHFS